MKRITKTYISVKEAAKLVDRSTWTIRRWIKKGLIEAEKFPPETGSYHVRLSDLPTFLREGKK